MKETFAGRVRQAAQALARADAPGAASDDWTVKDLGHQMGTKTYADHDKIRSVLRDMMRRNEVERTAKGRYRYAGAGHRAQGTGQIQQRMWKILRARRTVNVEDLQELAGASKGYALEWLQMMTRQGIAKRIAQSAERNDQTQRWQLVRDPVEMPRNDEKAERLRGFRIAQKADALRALDQIRGGVAALHEIVRQIPVEDE
jgi:hypothetical protein